MAAFNRHLSCLDIVKSVLGQMGLPAPISVVANPNDHMSRQMLFLLNSAGTKLVKPGQGYRWQVLQKTWQFTTAPPSKVYDLPADWDSFIDQTGQGMTLGMPLLGPVSAPIWNQMRAATSGPTISIMYRTRGDKFELFSVPAAPQTLFIDYSSRGWVQATAGGAYSDVMTKDDDICLYDADLIVAALKLRFLQEKGFDTTTAQNDFDLALELAINADTDAPVLNPSSPLAIPLIDACNLPATGIGS